MIRKNRDITLNHDSNDDDDNSDNNDDNDGDNDDDGDNTRPQKPEMQNNTPVECARSLGA